MKSLALSSALLLCIGVSASAPALAQSGISIGIGDSGISIGVQDDRPDPAASPPAAAGTVEARVTHEKLTNRESLNARGTRAYLFAFRGAPGARCQLTNDNSWFGTTAREVPFEFEAPDGNHMTFECTLPNGLAWRQRLQPKEHTRTVVTFEGMGSAAPSAPARHAPSAAPARQAAPQAMSRSSFQALTKRVDDRGMSRDKLRAIGDAARDSHFTCAQVAELVGMLSMSKDQVEVVRLTSSQIVDINNRGVILDKISFRRSREEAEQILAGR